MDVDVTSDALSIDDAGAMRVSAFHDPGSTAQFEPASRSRFRTRFLDALPKCRATSSRLSGVPGRLETSSSRARTGSLRCRAVAWISRHAEVVSSTVVLHRPARTGRAGRPRRGGCHRVRVGAYPTPAHGTAMPPKAGDRRTGTPTHHALRWRALRSSAQGRDLRTPASAATPAF